MEFPCTLLASLLLLLLAVQVQSTEHCPSPSSVAEFKNTVIEAACSYNPDDSIGLSFRNQTRFDHGRGDKTDRECTFRVQQLHVLS